MSQLLIHRSPLGPLSIPGVLGEPAPGEPFEVDDDIAETLLAQGDLYKPAPDPEVTVRELRDIAERRGIDLAGARTKAEIAAVIASHEDTVVVPGGDPTPDAIEAPASDPQEGGEQL